MQVPTTSTRGALYLPLLAAAAVLPRVVDQAWPTRIPSPGVAVHLVLTMALLCAAAVAWWRAPMRYPQDRWTQAFLALFAVLWVWAGAVMALRSELPVVEFAVMLLMLVMVATKVPTFEQARAAMAWTAVILALGVWVAWILGRFGYLPSDWATNDHELCRPAGPPPVLPFRSAGTWGGPFGTGNIMGQVAAYVAFFGLAQRGWLRWALVASGGYFVLISESETAIVAFLAGIGAMVLMWVLRTRSQPIREISVIGFFGIGAAVIMGYLYINPTMSERTTGWAQLMPIWSQHPLLGVPEGDIAAAIAAYRLPPWAALHAHNMWLDILVRNGLIALLLAVAVIAIALVLTVRSGRAGMAVPIAVLTSMLVAGLGEKVFSWGHGIRVNVLLLLIVLAASAWLSEHAGPEVPADRTPSQA